MIASGIVDNDPKGGRGTRFWMTVTVGEKTDHYEYTLLDELEGKFNREAIIKPAREEAARLRKELESKEAAEKKAALEQRQAAVSIDPALDTIIDTVISNNSKVVSEYQSGKDKALNSLVGMVIKEVKQKNLPVVDAFTITTALKKKLGR